MKTLNKDQNTSYVELLAAEARFLSSFGWRPCAPIVTGAPMTWKDYSGEEFRQDQAVEKQKMRVVDILYRD